MASNFFDLIRNFFTGARKEAVADGGAATTIVYNHEEYIATQLQKARAAVPALEEMFGKDFMQFFYGRGKEFPISDELLEAMGFAAPHHIVLDNDYWATKHPFNFPGPFYTGQTDTCGTGDGEAPFNVLYDSWTMEYVFRQPKNYVELMGVVNAGAVEVFGGYACNGNSKWTYTACRDWWANKEELITLLSNPEIKAANGGREQLYIDYLNMEAETDLRRYCYFLENNVFPNEGDKVLPAL